MKDYAALIRHDGNRHLFEAVEMSIISQLWGEPLHLHAEGVRGTGKTTILRAARRILPRIERIRGCPYNCDPKAPHCPLHARWTAEQVREHGTEWIPMPFREISPSAKVGTVTGSLDLARLTDRARPEAALLPGTLAQAHRGIVLVDEINRLADIAPDLVDCLLDVMGTKPGRLQIEETGLPPVELPVRVAVWAASNPDEEPGPLEEIRRQLSDRFDMVLDVRRPADRSLVKRILQLAHAPGGGAAASVAGAALAPGQVAAPAAAGSGGPAAAEGTGPAGADGRTARDGGEQDSRYRWREIAAARPSFPDPLFDLLAEVYVQFRLESLRAMEAWRQAATLYAARGGRSQVTCRDLLEVAPAVLRHRVEAGTLSEILEYLSREEEARAGGRDGRPAARMEDGAAALAGAGEAGAAGGVVPAAHPGAGGKPGSETTPAGGAAALAAQATAREGAGGVWSRLRDFLGRGVTSGGTAAPGGGEAGGAGEGVTGGAPLRPGAAAATTPLHRARPLLELSRDRAIRSWQEH